MWLLIGGGAALFLFWMRGRLVAGIGERLAEFVVDAIWVVLCVAVILAVLCLIYAPERDAEDGDDDPAATDVVLLRLSGVDCPRRTPGGKAEGTTGAVAPAPASPRALDRPARPGGPGQVARWRVCRLDRPGDPRRELPRPGEPL